MFWDSSIALIFGGCCSNVFTLESIVKNEPDSGLLITFSQLALTSLVAFPSQIDRQGSSWRIKRPVIPLLRLFIISFMFFTINMLNNWAFAFDISVPMHIILRSFGSVSTLVMGWIWGKRYSPIQISSVAALTVGVVVSAWADASAKGTSMDLTGGSVFGNGLLVLLVAQLLSAFMGIFVEGTYARYGRHWREILFYTHALGLIFSIVFYPSLNSQFTRLWASQPYQMTVWLRETLPDWIGKPHDKYWSPPRAILSLFLNAITQVICISGVNKLSAQTTAVTVTVVLNIRKLVSFLLSCWIFSNPISVLMACGATIVFGAGALYGWDSGRQKEKSNAIPSSSEPGEWEKAEPALPRSPRPNHYANGSVSELSKRY